MNGMTNEMWEVSKEIRNLIGQVCAEEDHDKQRKLLNEIHRKAEEYGKLEKLAKDRTRLKRKENRKKRL